MNVHMLPFVVFSEEKRLKKVCNIYIYIDIKLMIKTEIDRSL